MSKEERNRDIMEHMANHCRNIAKDRARAGDSLEAFLADEMYQRSCMMSILQIGELSTRLTDGFKAAHPDVPWQLIKAMRNYVAHEYDKVIFKSVWGTMTEDVPELLSACERILKELG